MKTTLNITLSAIIAITLMSGCATDNKQASKQRAEVFVVKDGKLLDASDQPMTGCVMMHNGKMMVMRDKLMLMKKSMTLSDGTVCKTSGTYVIKSGEKHKLAEGEALSRSGKLFSIQGMSSPGSP